MSSEQRDWPLARHMHYRGDKEGGMLVEAIKVRLEERCGLNGP